MRFPATTGSKAAEIWSEESQEYNFRSHAGANTQHFTQMVWYDTTLMGVARSSDGLYVVANYATAGNKHGEFAANVFPAGTTVLQAEQLRAQIGYEPTTQVRVLSWLVRMCSMDLTGQQHCMRRWICQHLALLLGKLSKLLIRI